MTTTAHWPVCQRCRQRHLPADQLPHGPETCEGCGKTHTGWWMHMDEHGCPLPDDVGSFATKSGTGIYVGRSYMSSKSGAELGVSKAGYITLSATEARYLALLLLTATDGDDDMPPPQAVPPS